LLPLVNAPPPEDRGRGPEVVIMLSPQISSALAAERQARYRREAEAARLARRERTARRRTAAARVAVTDAPRGPAGRRPRDPLGTLPA
jgi:hypothetical protein